MRGYLRSDGRKGIRNVVVVAYLVECAHHVARQIASQFPADEVHLIGFPGCYPNDYANLMMKRLCTHPNVGGCLLVSLGCESFAKRELKEFIQATGRPVDLIGIQDTGGTRKTIEQGRGWVAETLKAVKSQPAVSMDASELIVGTICGGSDYTSGLTANPAVGRAFDLLVDRGAATIFEETNEMVSCGHLLSRRAATPELGVELERAIDKAMNYHRVLERGSFAAGNASGGLTTLEEKSLGAYLKSGESPIVGLIKPGDIPPRGGLYLLDVVPDGEVRFGFPNISDNAEIAELIACGSHIILFTTGRGSVVGSAISPVIKVCANPTTYKNLADDMDINAGRIIEGEATVDDVGVEIFDMVLNVAGGDKPRSEALGHQEFILTYKSFEPIGPSCLPR